MQLEDGLWDRGNNPGKGLADLSRGGRPQASQRWTQDTGTPPSRS